MRSISKQLLLIVCLWPISTLAQALEPVTGVIFDGEKILWNAMPGATGYNVHLNFQYIDTVRGDTSYVPTESGRFYIAAFDDEGNFSPLQVIEDDVVATTNSVSVMLSPSAELQPPENTFGTVYSNTAGEVFWDRVIAEVLEYDIYLNDTLLGVSNGTSFFIDSLLPNAKNTVSVAGRNSVGTTSDRVQLQFDTSRDGFPFPATDPDLDPGDGPLPPQNVRLLVYSLSAAELIWDRSLPQENIVSTEISRDGVILGTTPGNSFYDDTRAPDNLHSYQLVAINADGVRSEPAMINPNPFDGSTDTIVQRLLAGITDVSVNNPHRRWIKYLWRFTQTTPDGLVQVSSEQFFDENFLLISRTQFNCDEGTLTRDYIPMRFDVYRFGFDQCTIDGGFIDGNFSLSGSDLGGYSANYDELFIDREEGNALFHSGGVTLNVFRSNTGMILTYRALKYSMVGNLEDDESGLDTEVELSQVIVDTLNPSPSRTTLETNFSVTAPWTRGRELFVTTTNEFTDADLGGGNYLTGDLMIAASNGERLEFSADTGDASRWLATVIKEDSSSGIVGNWGEDIRLPCVSFSRDEAAIPGCTLRSDLR